MEETKDLWILAGPDLEEKGLVDGEVLFYDLEVGNTEHRDLCKKFAREHNIDISSCSSHTDFGQLFTSLGLIMFLNVGNIDGKRAGGLYLPPHMSEKQIEYLEDKKELFHDKFHENVSLFGILVLKEEGRELEYHTNNGFRILEIESIIEGKPSKNGQKLLYREIDRQKEQLKAEKNK